MRARTNQTKQAKKYACDAERCKCTQRVNQQHGKEYLDIPHAKASAAPYTTPQKFERHQQQKEYGGKNEAMNECAVSYTHLTLPTNREV